MKNDIYNLKAITLIFCAIGLVILYSASSTIASSMFSNYQYFFINQSIRLFIGLIFLFFLSLVDYRLYRKYHKIILYLCWVLIFLGYLTSQNLPTSRGIILFGKNIVTTSDLSKLGLIIFLASFIEINRKKINNIKLLFLELLPYIFLTLFMIFFQPDMSTTFTISIILLSMIYIAGINFKYIASILFFSSIIVMIKIISTPFQKIRFLNWYYGLDDGQSTASILSLSNGGFWGSGLGESLFKKGLLPAVHTDFILPIIGEEFGFIGIVAIFILFFLFLFFAVKILQKIPDTFGFFLGVGIVLNIIFYFLINSAYVVGIFPTTGLPLPFISYGGSHLVLTLASMGILFNIANQALNKKAVSYVE